MKLYVIKYNSGEESVEGAVPLPSNYLQHWKVTYELKNVGLVEFVASHSFNVSPTQQQQNKHIHRLPVSYKRIPYPYSPPMVSASITECKVAKRLASANRWPEALSHLHILYLNDGSISLNSCGLKSVLFCLRSIFNQLKTIKFIKRPSEYIEY